MVTYREDSDDFPDADAGWAALFADAHAADAAEYALPRSDPGLRVLIVGADASTRISVRRWAEAEGALAASAPDRLAAARRLGEGRWDVVLAVHDGEDEAGLAPWREMLRASAHALQLLVATSRPSLRLALEAATSEATELLPLPAGREHLARALDRARAIRRNGSAVLHPAEPSPMATPPLVGSSASMLEVFKQIALVAPTTATVLLQGESGTGKELVAREIHANGPRRKGPFVAVNCAAIPENLLESELFGHEKGAFTGAIGRRLGQFERANGGTLLLDEIGDLDQALQAKILRAVEEREIERVGDGRTVPVDVRLVTATNRDLRTEVQQGRFREDLYFRVAVVTIPLPPLRERGEDVLLLALHFVRQFSRRHGKRIAGIADEAAVILRRHPWPGNVRELRNVVERAVLVAKDATIRPGDLPAEVRREPEEGGDERTLAAVEAQHIKKTLAASDGRIDTAAKVLGIHRNTLARKIREYGL